MEDDLTVSAVPAPDTADSITDLPQTRLKGYSRSFEGLMSLIPAKEYYGKDASITSVCATPHPAFRQLLTMPF